MADNSHWDSRRYGSNYNDSPQKPNDYDSYDNMRYQRDEDEEDFRISEMIDLHKTWTDRESKIDEKQLEALRNEIREQKEKIRKLSGQKNALRKEYEEEIRSLKNIHHDQAEVFKKIILDLKEERDQLQDYHRNNANDRKAWNPGKLRHIIKVAGERSGRKICNCGCAHPASGNN